MEAMLTLLMLVTAVASRNVPNALNPDFVPSLELLESIFNPPVSEKPLLNPFEVAAATDDTIPMEKKNSNVDETKDFTVEVSLKICVGAEFDKNGVSIQEYIKLNGNANTTKARDGEQAKTKKDNVKVTSDLVDRTAFKAPCPKGQVRVLDNCIIVDTDPNPNPKEISVETTSTS